MDPAVQDFVKTLSFRLGKRLPTEVHLIENASKKIGKILDNLSFKICRREILGLNNLDNMSKIPICYKH